MKVPPHTFEEDPIELPAETLRLVLDLAVLTEHRADEEQAALIEVAELVRPEYIPEIVETWERDEDDDS